MWLKHFNKMRFNSLSATHVALLAGLATVFAFSPFSLCPLAIAAPGLLFWALDFSSQQPSPKRAFWLGLLCALVVMTGGFYWIVYVVHVFGETPWVVAVLAFILFAFLGALNFPLFSVFACYLQQRLQIRERRPWIQETWWIWLLPALFTWIEHIVPKLFPWSLGHCWFPWLIPMQVVELTGISFLSFLSAATGGLIYFSAKTRRVPWSIAGVGLLWIATLSFGAWRIHALGEGAPNFSVGIVQANIGSLDKRMARNGVASLVAYTVEKYRTLTDNLIPLKPDLIVWPETALPFALNLPYGFSLNIRTAVEQWNIPLLTGAYLVEPAPSRRDYNAAFLLEPKLTETSTTNGVTQEVRVLPLQTYKKNILLAFGESFPGGETFPFLYRWFPQVSNFDRGTEQDALVLSNGKRIGVTICYEAIVPSFFRRVAAENVDLFVNITNDSWFGPTSEPYQHAALSVFRAIETRRPLVRSTNTGTSFAVDVVGRRSVLSPTFQEYAGIVHLNLTKHAPTLFMLWGDWFVVLCGLSILIFWVRLRNAPLSL